MDQAINIQLYYLILFFIPYLIGGYIYFRSGNIWKTASLFAICQLAIIYNGFY